MYKFIFIFLFLVGNISQCQNIIKKNDKFTNEPVEYVETKTYSNGDLIDKSICDGVIFINENDKFYKRILKNNIINIKWFGVKGDGNKNDIGTDDTNNIEKALNILSKIYKVELMSAGSPNGGFTLFFPNGKYLVNKTFVLPNAITIEGENMLGAIIHAKIPKFIFTNIQGLASNKTDVLMSSHFKISNITLQQGGLQLQNAINSSVENVRILDLFDLGDVGISIKIPVNLLIKNVSILNCSGFGIKYEDNAGSGPSTTTTFDNIRISHTKTAMLIDGNNGGSHGILTSKIYNSIFEYNDEAIIMKGNIENFAIRDCHFEQNEIRAISISGNVNLVLENIWSDSVGDLYFDKSISKTSRIYLKNVKMKLQNENFAQIISCN
jgi:hypothetical protein